MAMANDLASRVLRTTVELRQLEFEIRAALETISQNSTPLERIDSKITGGGSIEAVQATLEDLALVM